MGLRPRPPALFDNVATEDSVSRSWAYNSISGSMQHKASGMRVSPCTGIQLGDREYRLMAGDIEFDDEPLGNGASATVWGATIKTTGMPVAVKTLKVDNSEARKLLLNEVRGLIESEGCENLVQWHAGFASQTGGHVHLVLERMDYGSLADLRKKLRGIPEPILATMAQQVLAGIDHLHSRRLLHNDIKPQNILLNSQGAMKITDFGITKAMDDSLCGTCVGTQTYLAPEKFLASTNSGYSFPADIWSFGVVMFELAAGVHPFASATSFAEIFNKVLHDPEPRLAESDGYSPELVDFVARCLTRDATERNTSQQLLAHPFIGCAATRDEFQGWLCDHESPITYAQPSGDAPPIRLA